MAARGLPESPMRARGSEVHLGGGQGVRDWMEGGMEKGKREERREEGKKKERQGGREEG